MLSSRLLAIGLFVFVASTKDKLPSSEPPSADTLYTRALIQVGSADYKGAEKTAKQGLKEFPEANGFHFILGECLFLGSRSLAPAYYQYVWEIDRVGPQDQKGQAAAKRVREIVTAGKSPDVEEVKRVVEAAGRSMSDPKAALATIRDVQKTRGPEFALRVFEAEALYADGDFKGAEPIYRELIKKDPTFVGAYVELSGLLDKLGRQKESEVLIAKAKSIDPENWQLLLPK